MSAPNTNGTALAKREESEKDTDGIGNLPAPIQQAIALRKMQNLVAAKLAGMSWGQNLNLETRRALADFGRQYNVDVVTEIHVLGNRIYLNAQYYLRRLSEMIAAGVVEYAVADHIEEDARLKAIAADPKAPADIRESATAEIYRRAMMRVEFQAPEKAASICAFRVKLKSLTREIVGCKWAGNGVRKNDPVGDASPVETSESRAARRAIRQIASHVPALAQQVEAVEVAASALEGEIARSTHEVAASIAAVSSMTDRVHTVSSAEYGGSDDAPLSPDAMLAADDPYQDDRDLVDELPLDDQRPARDAIRDGGR